MTATIIKISPSAKVTLPDQSIGRRRGSLRSSQLQVGPDGPEQPDRDRDQEHQSPVDRCQQAAQQQSDEHAADTDDVVDPKAIPRWLTGNASVMIAAALASRHAPPMPCTTRKPIR